MFHFTLQRLSFALIAALLVVASLVSAVPAPEYGLAAPVPGRGQAPVISEGAGELLGGSEQSYGYNRRGYDRYRDRRRNNRGPYRRRNWH